MNRVARHTIVVLGLSAIWWCAAAAVEASSAGGISFATSLVHPNHQSLALRLLGFLWIALTIFVWRRTSQDTAAAGAALLASEDRYRDLVENCPDSIIVYRDDHLLYVNQTARDFLQIAPGTPLESLSVTGFIHPDDRKLSAQRRLAIAAGHSNILPPIVRLILPNGNARSTMVSTCRIEYEGQPALLSFCRDVTDQMATRHNLAMSQERLSLALEAARDGAWDWDMVNNRLNYNEAWAGMLGLPPFAGEHSPETWLSLVHPDDKERSLQRVQDHIAGQTPSYETELRLRHADGHYIWVLDRGRVVERAGDGTSLRMAGTHREITARKRAEIALATRNRIAEVFLTSPRETVFESILSAIGDATDSPTVVLGLMETERHLHLSSRLAGRDQTPTTEIWQDYQDQLPTLFHEALDNGQPIIPATSVTLPPLPRDLAPSLLVPIKSQERSLGFLIVADRNLEYGPDDVEIMVSLAAYLAPILEFHLESAGKEHQMRQAQKMEAVGALAGGIAHDFNNILQAILGFSTLALEEVQSMDSHAGSFIANDLERVMRATQRGQELVERILLFSRRQEQDHQAVDLGTAIGEAVDLLTNAIPATIEVCTDIEPNCRPIWADPTQISQVLLNLATNSFHAMEKQGGVLTFGLKQILAGADTEGLVPPALKGGDLVTLRITDTGTGIDAATLERIFDPFFTTKEVGKGTGLGLSMVHGIVNGLEGDITIESVAGQGTTVRVFLPTIPAQNSDGRIPPFAMPARGQVPTAPRPGRILLVDDEADIVIMAKSLLVKQGHQVTAHTSSPAALAALRAAPDHFDLLITDLTMPGMTGLQLAAEVAGLRPGLPVVLITGLNEELNQSAEEQTQICGILHKPFGGDTLREAVDTALAGSAPTEDPSTTSLDC